MYFKTQEQIYKKKHLAALIQLKINNEFHHATNNNRIQDNLQPFLS